MTRTQFNSLRDSVYAEITQINDTKGKDYSGDEDALANFKRLSGNLGLSPEQILMVYLQKHLDAITTYCKAGQVESEPIEGRINDAILYLFLLRGLVEERNSTTPTQDNPRRVRPCSGPCLRVEVQDGKEWVPVTCFSSCKQLIQERKSKSGRSEFRSLKTAMVDRFGVWSNLSIPDEVGWADLAEVVVPYEGTTVMHHSIENFSISNQEADPDTNARPT